MRPTVWTTLARGSCLFCLSIGPLTLASSPRTTPGESGAEGWRPSDPHRPCVCRQPEVSEVPSPLSESQRLAQRRRSGAVVASGRDCCPRALPASALPRAIIRLVRPTCPRAQDGEPKPLIPLAWDEKRRPTIRREDSSSDSGVDDEVSHWPHPLTFSTTHIPHGAIPAPAFLVAIPQQLCCARLAHPFHLLTAVLRSPCRDSTERRLFLHPPGPSPQHWTPTLPTAKKSGGCGGSDYKSQALRPRKGRPKTGERAERDGRRTGRKGGEGRAGIGGARGARERRGSRERGKVRGKGEGVLRVVSISRRLAQTRCAPVARPGCSPTSCTGARGAGQRPRSELGVPWARRQSQTNRLATREGIRCGRVHRHPLLVPALHLLPLSLLPVFFLCSLPSLWPSIAEPPPLLQPPSSAVFNLSLTRRCPASRYGVLLFLRDALRVSLSHTHSKEQLMGETASKGSIVVHRPCCDSRCRTAPGSLAGNGSGWPRRCPVCPRLTQPQQNPTKRESPASRVEIP